VKRRRALSNNSRVARLEMIRTPETAQAPQGGRRPRSRPIGNRGRRKKATAQVVGPFPRWYRRGATSTLAVAGWRSRTRSDYRFGPVRNREGVRKKKLPTPAALIAKDVALCDDLLARDSTALCRVENVGQFSAGRELVSTRLACQMRFFISFMSRRLSRGFGD